MNDMTDLEMAYYQLGNAEEYLAQMQISHMPTDFWEHRVAQLKQAARELEEKYADEYFGLLTRLGMVVNSDFANLTDMQLRSKIYSVEHRVDTLRKYLQQLCKHDKVTHHTTGSMWFNGDVMDDLDDKLICDICGKEVTINDAEDLQGNEESEF